MCYVYLHIDHQFTKTLNRFWDDLKEDVRQKKLGDMASLQYPPHITLAGSFEMKDLSQFEKDMKEVFGHPFESCPKSQRISPSSEIQMWTFEWYELSERVEKMKQKYPNIPWITKGYHLTLAHNGNFTTMMKVYRRLPKFPLIERDFNFTLWQCINTPNGQFSFERKKWTKLVNIPMKTI